MINVVIRWGLILSYGESAGFGAYLLAKAAGCSEGCSATLAVAGFGLASIWVWRNWVICPKVKR